MKTAKAENVWKCLTCRALNLERVEKCGDCGKTRTVLDPFVGKPQAAATGK